MIQHIPEGSHGVARTISYHSILLLLIDAEFGPVPRKDTLLHAALIVARIEVWFTLPDYTYRGFFKFVDAVPGNSRFYNRNYTPGDSWCEELGFSRRMFETAFALVGTTHKSLGFFREARKVGEEFLNDEGVECLYCAAHDNLKGYSMFYRNHRLADRLFKPPDKPKKDNKKGK